MIVRVMTEGQYRLDGGLVDAVQHADEALLHAVHANDKAAFHEHLTEALTIVRQGVRLNVHELVPSDLVLPSPDMSVAEARKLLDQHPID
jgi:CBS-domain-containing membrane protein